MAKIFKRRNHNHSHCVENALQKATRLCQRQDARLTELRARVLELIWRNHRPVGAYDLLDMLRHERGSAAPPTVYRALDFLIEHGLVHKIESQNTYIGCSASVGHDHPSQFLICRQCGVAAEITDPRLDEAIGDLATEAGFVVAGRTIEVEGYCPDCRQSNHA